MRSEAGVAADTRVVIAPLGAAPVAAAEAATGTAAGETPLLHGAASLLLSPLYLGGSGVAGVLRTA
jgi:hypothetical protein